MFSLCIGELVVKYKSLNKTITVRFDLILSLWALSCGLGKKYTQNTAQNIITLARAFLLKMFQLTFELHLFL